MDTVFQNMVVQMGAIGIMIAGLAWFSRYLFLHQMNQNNELRADIKRLIEANNELETEFRAYLISTAKEHHEIIKNNTEAYNKFVLMIDRYISSYAVKKN